MTEDELVDIVLERLREFSPAIAIKHEEAWEEDQIELCVLMCRTPADFPKSDVQ